MNNGSSTQPKVTEGEVLNFKPEPLVLIGAVGAAVLALSAACWLLYFNPIAGIAWLTGKFALGGGCLFAAVGAVLVYYAVRRMFIPEALALVIGSDRLQIVANGAHVKEQYPYVDVDSFQIATKKGPSGPICISLVPSPSRETIPPSETMRAHLNETFGCPAVIENRFEVPIDEVLKKVLSRYEAYKATTATPGTKV